jgi:hypothetical protein
MSLRFPPKTSFEKLTYVLDFSRLVRRGATLASATWLVPDGLTLVSEVLDAAACRASVKLSGGTAATDYALRCQAVDSDGEEYERYVDLRVIAPKPL